MNDGSKRVRADDDFMPQICFKSFKTRGGDTREGVETGDVNVLRFDNPKKKKNPTLR